MKFFIVLLLTFAFAKADVPIKVFGNVATKGINEKLLERIESLREILRNGNASLGLPVMDPLVMKDQKVSLDSKLFSGDVALDKLIVSALSDYQVQKAEFAMVGLKLTLGMQWSDLKGKGAYGVKGVALNFINIYGSGNFKLMVSDFSFTTTISLGTNPRNKTMLIKEMATSVVLGDLQFTIDGLFNDKDLSDVTSAIVSDLAPGVVEKYQKQLTEAVHTFVMSEANKVLSTMTLKDLLALIQ
ncbi:uncharacterized protein LOC117182976 [Belonocnema kinseyi]|uniref:uncharacterized protein LOC117182976 n=1 Tax=Belonocnema kinseyi TaxID=2817044 RepID=UPI00143D1BFB|nr:uncharacterized protein LOC117182976 [Belonocnema kinseyi]